MKNATSKRIAFAQLQIAAGHYDIPEIFDDAMNQAFDDANKIHPQSSRCMSGSYPVAAGGRLAD